MSPSLLRQMNQRLNQVSKSQVRVMIALTLLKAQIHQRLNIRKIMNQTLKSQESAANQFE